MSIIGSIGNIFGGWGTTTSVTNTTMAIGSSSSTITLPTAASGGGGATGPYISNSISSNISNIIFSPILNKPYSKGSFLVYCKGIKDLPKLIRVHDSDYSTGVKESENSPWMPLCYTRAATYEEINESLTKLEKLIYGIE